MRDLFLSLVPMADASRDSGLECEPGAKSLDNDYTAHVIPRARTVELLIDLWLTAATLVPLSATGYTS